MQRAEIIISLLSQKAKNDECFVFRRLYRHLYNPDLYQNAFRHIYIGSEPKASELSMEIVDAIIQKMKTETYHPQPVIRPCGQQPPGCLSFEDRLVQEGLRQLLQAIYEPQFLESSHGFRPERSHLTALSAIKASFGKADWLITGKIKNVSHFDHDTLIQLLSRKIDDGRLLELIRRFLRAGYVEVNPADDSLVIQRGITPLLLNIYLHELDTLLQRLSLDYSNGRVQANKPEQMRTFERAENALKRVGSRLNEGLIDGDDSMVKYIRFADRFVVGITGSKRLAEAVRDEIQSFLKQTLKLELDTVYIANPAEKRVRFLDYEITRSIQDFSPETKKKVIPDIRLLVPGDVIRTKLRPFCKNGIPIHHHARIHWSVPDLIRRYTAEIRELYSYYHLAADVNAKLGRFRYYHYHSLAKTIARKEKRSVKQVLAKYGIEVKRRQGGGSKKMIGIRYQDEDGKEQMLTYFNEPLKRCDDPRYLSAR
ncbi:reverse transcriptase/maturase family protein [Desmospora activa]|uniref:Reverse transcriptase (RNA-dependent DNA polymerase) n=1 Tax=Desmospora activa DSM 45169 TaxID=1121389 RepID=A0A2T4Z4T1_9BACL|nr:reverse transcriptase/maturase family protein [Desmospora activa]PTM56897.1 reverse transcriptase (RNA-dependent DNA polymerase) [Desmospora activa DSM 45169]